MGRQVNTIPNFFLLTFGLSQPAYVHARWSPDMLPRVYPNAAGVASSNGLPSMSGLQRTTVVLHPLPGLDPHSSEKKNVWWLLKAERIQKACATVHGPAKTPGARSLCSQLIGIWSQLAARPEALFSFPPNGTFP